MLRSQVMICAGLLALACAGAENRQPPEEPKVAQRNPFVRISNSSLSPSVTRVKAGSRVTFVNLSNYLAVVTLRATTADFECKALRPTFQMDGDQIRSTPIAGNGNQVTLPCAMKAGSYDYLVQLSAGIYSIGNQQLEYSGKLLFDARQAP